MEAIVIINLNKFKVILSLLLISMIFTSCIKGSTSQSEINSSEMPSTIESSEGENLEDLEPIIFNPGDKTKLTYAISELYDIPKRLQDSINIYLDSIGKSYYVDFKTLSFESYTGEIRKLAKSGEVDILFTGYPWEDGYNSLIKDGTILNLDGFLSSDEGGELYNSVPESVWKSLKRDGKIYGACGYVYTQVSPPSYTINKELMEKYNLKVNDFRKPLGELEDIFKMVKEGEGEDFYPLYADINFELGSLHKVTDTFSINRTTSKVEYLWENNDYMNFIKAIYRMQDIGLFNYENREEQYYNLDKYLLYYSYMSPTPEEFIHNGLTVTHDRYATHEDVVVITFDEYGWYSWRNYFATSICSKTGYQDEALDLLTTIFTDRVVTDYLLYGIENEDYTIEDGRISRGDFEKDPPLDLTRFLSYGNDFISTPKYFEFDDKEVRYREMCDKLQDSPLMYFEFDEGEYADEINKSDEAMEIIQTSLEQNLSYDEMLSELKKAFGKIKTDEIIAEMQKQLDSFLEE